MESLGLHLGFCFLPHPFFELEKDSFFGIFITNEYGCSVRFHAKLWQSKERHVVHIQVGLFCGSYAGPHPSSNCVNSVVVGINHLFRY